MKTIVKNHGIDINVACFSCSHFVHNLSRDDAKKYGSTSICARDNSACKRSDSCPKWECKEGLMNAGNGTGDVHTPEYITFYRANLDEANAYIEEYMKKYSNDLRMRMQCPSIPQYIYLKWKEVYGSKEIFMNI